MRIVVLCGDLGIRVPGDKGASLHLQAITRAFGAIGHDVLMVAVAGHGPADLTVDAPGSVQTALLPHPGRTHGLRRELRKLRFTAALADRIEDQVRAFRPDVIYERLSLFGTAGRDVAGRLALPHVIEVNALLAREDAKWRGLHLAALARRRETTALAGADLRVAVSAEVAAAVDAVCPGRTIVVPNGVERRVFAQLPDQDAARADLGIGEGFWVGFTGALRPWHGVDRAIRALALLPHPCRLAIAGDGPIAGRLQTLAREVGVADRIAWLGQVAHDRIPTVLAAIDVAIAPYPAGEEFAFSPLKVYEYLAAGRPTIASDIGQLRDLLDARPGAQLVPAGDPAALARAIDIVRRDRTWEARALAGRAAFVRDNSWERRAHDITAAIATVSADAAAA